MTIDNVLASVAVRDLKAAAAWYEKLFRRPPDSTPMPEVVEWKFARGGWLQVYQLPERAGGGSCTLAVNDIDEVVAHLQSLGIDTSEQTSGTKIKTVMITDLDGITSPLPNDRPRDGAVVLIQLRFQKLGALNQRRPPELDGFNPSSFQQLGMFWFWMIHQILVASEAGANRRRPLCYT
jgi:hypothetical protein